MLLYIFFAFLLLQLLLSLESLRGGFRFSSYINSRLKADRVYFEGLVTVIVPCKGDEDGLEMNLESVLAQKRTDFEVLFVVGSDDDSAVPVISKLLQEYSNARLISAGKAENCGQKVHNIRFAVRHAHEDSKAFVFADSDARPSVYWLDDLLSPLNDTSNGCSTGYRWFIQRKGGFATHLRAAWNASIASSLGSASSNNFCWGGAMAVRREVFEELQIGETWRGTVSDDFALTSALKKSKYRIHFEPRCLTPTVGDCSFSELLEFTNRQMRITRIYSQKHFVVSMIGALLFSLTFIAGSALLFWLDGTWFYTVAVLILVLWSLGSIKSIQRLQAIVRCLPEYRASLWNQAVPQLLLWPISAFLFLINDLNALLSNRLNWRGISYELVSDKETRIIES